MVEQMMSRIREAITDFVHWLDSFGETSHDHQDFYASNIGVRANALYYRKPLLGMLAVLPTVFCKAFIP